MKRKRTNMTELVSSQRHHLATPSIQQGLLSSLAHRERHKYVDRTLATDHLSFESEASQIERITI